MAAEFGRHLPDERIGVLLRPRGGQRVEVVLPLGAVACPARETVELIFGAGAPHTLAGLFNSHD